MQPSTGTAVNTLINSIDNQIVTPVIYLLMTLAVLYFMYGVFNFIRHAEDAEKRKEGANAILWGLVGVFIMVSAKGLINIIVATISQ